MAVTTVALFCIVFCAVKHTHAGANPAALANRVRFMEREMGAWIRSAVDTEAKVLDFEETESTLKQEMIETFVPPLIKRLVKQAITDILKEDYIRHITNGRILDEVDSLNADVQNTKAQLKAITQELRQAERERDTYRKSLRKLQGRVTKGMKRITGLTEDFIALNVSCCEMRKGITESSMTTPALTTTYPGTTAATPSQADRDLFSASEDGDLETVRRILSTGHVNINTRGGWWNRTAVMVAARYGHRDVLELLVAKGADLSLVDMDRNNILHLASMGGHLEIVKLILSLNVVDINAKSNFGLTAAGVARGRKRQQVLDFLMSLDAR